MLRYTTSVAWAPLVAVALSVTPNAGHAQFDTVINSPPTIIGDRESIGSNTQINVFEGGSVGNEFAAGENGVIHENVEVNISGERLVVASMPSPVAR